MILTPTPGDLVQSGNSAGVWTIGEVVPRPSFGEIRAVANLHNRSGQTQIHVPLHELYVVTPLEARHGYQEVPTESEVFN